MPAVVRRFGLIVVTMLIALVFRGAGAAPATGPADVQKEPPQNEKEEKDEKLAACERQLQTLHKALVAYERDRHKLPDELSDLWPDYVKDKALFRCPADPTAGTPARGFAHTDPHLPVSYSYEFNAAVSHGLPCPLGPFPKPDVGDAWGTNRLVNEHEAYFFGDQVPVVRCFHHKSNESEAHKVPNLTRSGRVYYFTGVWEDHPDSLAAVLKAVDRDLAAGPAAFEKNWNLGRLREYTGDKAGRDEYAALKPLFRQAGARLAAAAGRLGEGRERPALALAGRYFIGAGDYPQALDAGRRSIRLAAAHGDYGPDKVARKWDGPAEGDMLLLADAYRGLGQPELELPLVLGLHYRKPDVGYFHRRLAEIHKSLGQTEAAEQWLDRADPARTLVGKAAPDFSLPPAAGGAAVSLKDVLKDRKAVLVNFWFCACGPCRAEAPELQRLYAGLKDKGLDVVAINHGDRPADVAKFVAEYGLTFPVLLGGPTADDGSDVAARYGVRGYPTSLLLDPSGKVVWYKVGYGDDQADKVREELGKLGVK